MARDGIITYVMINLLKKIVSFCELILSMRGSCVLGQDGTGMTLLHIDVWLPSHCRLVADLSVKSLSNPSELEKSDEI